jgi:hypothetical protein
MRPKPVSPSNDLFASEFASTARAIFLPAKFQHNPAPRDS